MIVKGALLSKGHSLDTCAGPVFTGVQPCRIQGYPQDERHRRESKEADSPWFTQKANKAPDTGLALFMEVTGALSKERRRRTPSLRSEDAERLLEWVLEARAKK